VTGYFEGRFTQRVNLRVPRLAAVRAARGWPLVPAVFRLFWHGRGCATRRCCSGWRWETVHLLAVAAVGW